MYNTLTDAPRMLEFLRKVLVNEVVKRTMREEKGREVTAVVAQGLARYKHGKSCCRLIRDGEVKLEDVLVLEDGKIALKEEACGGDGNEHVLAELCCLMPLAMGTTDLFMQ
ncbi:hypothetical protein NLG97_g5616 [Lecanicillium saksenae]|uniref:Uncharacterized protein n=1 Tax=Lecanicillium saksenae TaxID=468837 RepID=A0ACC1QUC2_9HYPO|nr:hypothetical protein NLG97_g5616 [Lecanicillium saksenae]